MALFTSEPDKSSNSDAIAKSVNALAAKSAAPAPAASAPGTDRTAGTAHLDRGTKISGQLRFDGPARIDGHVDGEIDAAHAAHPAGDHEVSLRSSLHTTAFTARYAFLPKRRNPLLVPVTPSEREAFDYELPAGAQARLPADTHLQTPFGSVDVSYRLDGVNLRVGTYAELIPQTVAAADYPAFRAFCKSADQALQRGVVIALP